MEFYKRLALWLRNHKEVVLLILFGIILCSPITVNGFFKTHDGTSHLSRIYNTVAGLKDWQMPSIIVSNFVKGFGYSWNLFYPPLSAYLGAVFYFLCGSYIGSLKLLIIFTIFGSEFTMYKLMKNVAGKKVGVISSLIYVSAPYFLTDIYLRYALGEIMTLFFMPILLYGLYNIFYQDGKKNYYLTIGVVGVVLSHILSALFVAAIIFAFCLFQVKVLFNSKQKNRIWKNLIVNCVFVILISAFFYLPFIESKFSTNYVVFNYGSMGDIKNLVKNSTYFYQLLFSKYQFGYSTNLGDGIATEMSFNIGFPIIISLIFTPFAYSKVHNKKLYLFTIIIGILCMWMSTNLFPWSITPKFLSIIQFPWRFLLITTICFSIIAGVNIVKIIVQVDRRHLLVIVSILLICSYQFFSNTIIFDEKYDISYLTKIDQLYSFYSGNYYCASYEYLPSKVKYDYLMNRTSGVIVLSGKTEIKNEKKLNNIMTFEVINKSNKTTLELPYIYYLGYTIKLNGKTIKYSESENGFISINLKNVSKGKIEVKYSGSFIMKTSVIISITGLLGFIYYIFKENIKNKRLK